jgi:hypothetical protein
MEMCPRAAAPPAMKHFASDAVGFFDMDNLTLLQENKFENMVFVLVDDPKISEKMIEQEIRKLVCEEWNWQVMRLTETDFSLIFLNAESLCLCQNAASLTLPTSKIQVIVLDEIQNLLKNASAPLVENCL